MARHNPLETGILTVLTQNIYFFIRASFYFIISVFPTILWFLVFDRSLIDLLFIALFGPAISAVVRFMVAYIETDFTMDDLPEFNHYQMFYRKNFKESLTFWIPYIIIMYIILTNIEAYDWGNYLLGLVMTGVYLLLAALLTLGVGYFFVISSKYAFKLKDLFRLSVYYTFTFAKSTFGILSVLILVLVTVFYVHELVILLLAGPLAYILVRYGYPVVENVGENFVK